VRSVGASGAIMCGSDQWERAVRSCVGASGAIGGSERCDPTVCLLQMCVCVLLVILCKLLKIALHDG
jgi:hypothetical protein